MRAGPDLPAPPCPYAFSAAKDRLQKSFLNHPEDRPFSPEQVEYVAADAEATARLYPIQVQAALAQNALNHLQRVEMDWTVTNARIIWDGVRIDPEPRERLQAAVRAAHRRPAGAARRDWDSGT